MHASLTGDLARFDKLSVMVDHSQKLNSNNPCCQD